MAELDVNLFDSYGPYDETIVKSRIDTKSGRITVAFVGYSDSTSENEGEIILIEYYEGELRLVVWSDKDQEDPTHIISLEGAKVNNVKNADKK